MTFHIPGEMLKIIDKSREKREIVLLDGRKEDLADIRGEFVCPSDGIRITQLGWLSMRRNVDYIIVRAKEGQVAVSVR